MPRISSIAHTPPHPALLLRRLGVIGLVWLVAGCGSGSGGGSSSDEATTAGQSAGSASPPAISLAADPLLVQPGETSWISWTATNADGCTASGDWTGSQPTSGSFRAGPLAATASFMLACSGPGGGSIAQVAVQVAGDDIPTVQISASPPGVPVGESSMLSWTSTNATACEASGDWSGDRPLSGVENTGPVSADTNFWLSCSGTGGNALELATVTVQAAHLSWDAPTENVDGSTLTDLAGFNIYWGTVSRQYDFSVGLDPAVESYQIQLAPGTYYFSMTATDVDGNESAFSNEVSKLII